MKSDVLKREGGIPGETSFQQPCLPQSTDHQSSSANDHFTDKNIKLLHRSYMSEGVNFIPGESGCRRVSGWLSTQQESMKLRLFCWEGEAQPRWQKAKHFKRNCLAMIGSLHFVYRLKSNLNALNTLKWFLLILSIVENYSSCSRVYLEMLLLLFEK